MATTILILEEYTRRVREYVQIMRAHFSTHDLLRACVAREVPRTGSIEHCRLSYTFHGVGCRIESEKGCVDFDFGPRGIVGGFDSWRLFQFVKSSKHYDSTEFTRQRLESDLLSLIQSGQVIASKLEPSPHLLYLANNADE